MKAKSSLIPFWLPLILNIPYPAWAIAVAVAVPERAVAEAVAKDLIYWSPKLSFLVGKDPEFLAAATEVTPIFFCVIWWSCLDPVNTEDLERESDILSLSAEL